MKSRILFVIGSFCIVLSDRSAWAASSSAVQELAITCVACHGANGISPNDEWPNLAGQKKGYLLKQLESFKNGDRVDALMSPISKTLSAEDMKILAQYFSEMGKAP